MSDNNMDIIEKIGSSMIQHGKLSDRVYIMKLNKNDFKSVLNRTEELCKKHNYSKVFAKVPYSLSEDLISRGYEQEAIINNFYYGEEDGIFLCKYLNSIRKNISNKVDLNNVLIKTKDTKVLQTEPKLHKDYTLRDLNIKDTEEMANLYKTVFTSYPFPIFDKNYLTETMRDNIRYAGIFHNNKLVSIASAEMYPDYLNAEMTDFATDKNHKGNNFSVILLKYLEEKLKELNYKTLYTIARAKSFPMNITFKKCGYSYCGTLFNNTNIAGSIESMNIWYKNY